MEISSIAQSVLALMLVLGLVGLCSAMLRKYGVGKIATGLQSRGKRLAISDALVIDARRKVVLIRCDDTEHLILLNHDKDIVIGSEKVESKIQNLKPEKGKKK